MRNKAISIILASSMLLTFASCRKKPADTSEEQSGQNVSVYTASLKPISSTVTYTGEIKASESVSISSKVGAKAIAVYHQEGDFVNAGDVLAKLDDTDIRLSYKQAEASYNSAVASYNMTVNSSTKQAVVSANQNLNSAQIAYESALSNYNREKQLYENNSQIVLAQQKYDDAKNAYDRQKELYDGDASVTAAKNALTTSEQNLERTQQLFNLGAASQLELDTAKNNVENARASYETAQSGAKTQLDNTYSAMVSAEENLKTTKISASASYENAQNSLKNAENALKNAKENIGLTSVSTKESISTASAAVESARASLATAKNMLGNTTIISPISGFVASKNINEGQMVGQGTEIFSVKNSNNVDAEIAVTEAVIPYVSIGTQAEVEIKSAGNMKVDGVVTLVNTVKNAQSGMYTVRVSIPNEDNRIKVGMFADVTLVTEQSESSVVIPSDALLQESGQMYVYVVNGNEAQRKDVLTGIQNSDYAEIISGIDEGDKVVVSGKEYISESNNKLNITSEEGDN